MQLCGQNPGQCFHVASVATIVTIAAIVGTYVYYRTKRISIATDWTEVATVKKLFIYPLKSGRRKELETATCKKHGATTMENNVELRDRSFIVYTKKSIDFITARTHPKLALIETSVDEDGEIVLSAPDDSSLPFKIPKSGLALPVAVHNKATVHALDCGREICLWLSSYLNEGIAKVRLGYHRPSFTRNIKQQFPNLFNAYCKLRADSAGLYSDLTSYLLINESSVEALNSNLTEPVTANNFRPNILVEGKNLNAYEEENWNWIRIGDAIFRNVKPCTRCVFVTIDPESGIMSKEREPLKSLKRTNGLKDPAHVECEGEKGVMGIHLELWREGQIRVGDKVFVA